MSEPLTREVKAALLGEPFPPDCLRTNQQKGNITYVPIAEVIARLNRVLGVGEWSYKVIDRWADGEQTTDTGTFPTWVMCHVTLRYRLEPVDPWVETDGLGGQAVKFLNNGKGPVDLGDEWKGAASDALKKACQSVSVGLDLARKEDALAWERRQEEADRPTPPPDGWASIDEHDAARGALGERIKALPEDYRGEIVDWFKGKGGASTGWAWPLPKEKFDQYEREVADAEATIAAIAGADGKAAPSGAEGAGPDQPAEGPASPAATDDASAGASTEGPGSNPAGDPPKDPSPEAKPPVEELESKAADISASIELMAAMQKRALRTWCASNGVPVAPDGKPDLINLDPDQLDRVYTYVATAA